jgi:hypothetical protein
MNNSTTLLSMIKQTVAAIIAGHDPFSHHVPVVPERDIPGATVARRWAIFKHADKAGGGPLL